MDLAIKNAEADAQVVLRVTVFGEFTIETADSNPVPLNNRRASLILAILCLQPGLTIDRSSLAVLLWPDRFAQQAKGSLRQCLHDLARQLEKYDFQGLTITRTEVALKRATIACDLHELETLLAQGEPVAASQRLIGIGNRPLLQGITLNAEFDDWLHEQRQHVDARLRAALSEVLSMGDKPANERLLEAAQARFPAYRTVAQSLKHTSLAVLPFSQSSEFGDNFFLADGVFDELSTQLGRIRGIALTGRTSIASVAAKGRTLPQIADELNVTHLVEGEVRRRGDRIEVHIALIEGGSGTQLWSDLIDGSVEDFLNSRKIIGANVIAAICGVLGQSTAPAPARRMTSDREAYALYLQGRSLIQRSIHDGAAAKSVELLERSLEIDPDFAECWTALADAHIHNAVFTPCLDRVERSKKAAECARRAVELDPAQGHALAIKGIHEWTRKNPARALDLAFEAYALEPQSADVASRLGSFLLYIGRTRDALPFIEAAIEQDPAYGRNQAMLSTAHFNLGNVDEAIVAGTRMVDLGMPGLWLAAARASQGDYETATADYYASRMLMNTVILPPAGTEPMADEARDAYWKIAAHGCCSGKAEDRAIYCQMLTGLHSAMPDPCDPSIILPAIWMGHAELVMKIYREQIHPANMFCLMSLWADTDPIRATREHPAFMQFAEEIGFVEAWERYGWPDVMPADPRNS
ncbi:MAG: hypothetical protein ABJP48_02425 [Erythrobacter sp.]